MITAPGYEDLVVLVDHVERVGCIVGHGGQLRLFYPLFGLVLASPAGTWRVWLNRVVKVVKSDCVFEVVRLYVQVVRGFLGAGGFEARRMREVPPEVVKLCAPYLNAMSG